METPVIWDAIALNYDVTVMYHDITIHILFQEAVVESDIDEFLMGMASQITEHEDNIIVPDLRGDVFGPLDFSRRDLMAINIQRGRDNGLPDYNTARRELDLPPITRWRDINRDLFRQDPDVRQRDWVAEPRFNIKTVFPGMGFPL